MNVPGDLTTAEVHQSPSRTALAVLLAAVWGGAILLLGYDALFHKYSRVQLGTADGRVVGLMVAFLVACAVSAGMLLWHRLINRNPSPSLVGLAALQLLLYALVSVLLDGFPAY